MSDLSITEFDPQTSDNERMLLARLLAYQRRQAVRGTLLSSASRTTSTSSGTLDLTQYSAAFFWLNISAYGGGLGLQVVLEYLDPVSGLWAIGPNTTSLTSAGCKIFGVSTGANAPVGWTISAQNGAMSGMPMNSAMRIRVYHQDATAHTYSVGYEYRP